MADNLIPFLERLHTDPEVREQAAPFSGALHVVAAQFAALSTAIGLPTSAEALEIAAEQAARKLGLPGADELIAADRGDPAWHGGSASAVSGAALIAAASQRDAMAARGEPAEPAAPLASPADDGIAR